MSETEQLYYPAKDTAEDMKANSCAVPKQAQ